ncbi:YhcH/YjgK/YiaL family protein [Arenibacter palladensis]|uniref:YhcH/YjgK/YiaL family protein n=1 Tax=Arenibacter palladensis TaxID=237373 RepID=UPI0026E169A3|nr:YhcH/YjgK/YiaL family protein [Arenibacter palladensis]MDO6605202.1 YhcH/YjgK/YiaL family protein [Arenibacter palladensis]
MKGKLNLLVIAVVIGISSLTNCRTYKKNNNWEGLSFTDSNINSSFPAKANGSINFQKAKEQFEKYPERWHTAFKFLMNSNLKILPLGKVDLSEEVYVTVSEYETKAFAYTKYESHKKYIDLQYLVSGKELIGLTNADDIPIEIPYSEDKDIMFYDYESGKYLKATPDTYFLFFPGDCHRPGLESNGKSMVRKIVIKIKYN